MKSLINIPLLREQLKRFWAIGFTAVVVNAMFVALPAYSLGNENPNHAAMSMVSVLTLSNEIATIMMVIMPLCAVIALFPYHFSSGAATAFHSFPLNKRQLYWTNVAAGLVLTLVPLLILSLALLIPVRYLGAEPWMAADGTMQFWRSHVIFPPSVFPRGVADGAVINTFPVVAGFFARLALGTVFYLALFSLAVSVSGNRVISLLLCGTLPLVPVGIHALLELIASVHVFGYDGNMDGRLFLTLAYSNPASWRDILQSGGYGGMARGTLGRVLAISHFPEAMRQIPFVIVYSLSSLAFFSLSYICSHRRKQERAGDSIVFTRFNKLMVFLVSFAGFLFVGAIMMAMTRSHVGLYLGYVIGFVLAYFVAQMLAEKTFYVKHTARAILPFAAVMVGLYITTLLIANFGMGSFVNRVPQQAEVAGVSFHQRWQWRWEHSFVDEPEFIARSLEIHQEIINNQRYLQRLRWQARVRGSWNDAHMLPLSYLLHDGTIMNRSYLLPPDFMLSAGVGELMASQAMVLSTQPSLSAPDRIHSIQLRRWDEDTERDEIFHVVEGEQIHSLVEAISRDLVEQAAVDWYIRTGGESTFEWGWRWMGIEIRFYTDEERQNILHDHISFGSDPENTLTWLALHEYLD